MSIFRRRKGRRYVSKRLDYHNPLFHERPQFSRSKPPRNPRPLGWWLAAVGVTAALYAVFFSPLFIIRDISVVGAEKIDPTVVVSAVQQSLSKKLLFIPLNTYFVISPNRLMADVENALSANRALNDITITRQLSHHLTVTLTERNDVLVLLTTDQRYFFDGEGIVTGQAPAGEEAIAGLPKVRDENSRPVQVGNRVLNAKLVSLILELNQKLPPTVPNLTIDYFAIPALACDPSTGECDFVSLIDAINVHTTEGWDIYTTSNLTADSQLEALTRVLQEKVKEERPNLSYVDLRFGERVYYKTK